MSKEDLINDILDKITQLNSMGNSGSMFLYGDSTDMVSVVALKGDMPTLATSFGRKMEKNQEFNRIMMSMFGSYLVNNPAQKEVFIQGIALSPLSMN